MKCFRFLLRLWAAVWTDIWLENRIKLIVTTTLWLMFSLGLAGTWTASVANTNAITREEWSVNGISTFAYSIKVGPVSSSFYYIYWNSNPSYKWLVRKIFSDNTLAWMTNSYPLESNIKSITFDLAEKYIYFATWTSPSDVVRLLTSTGAFDSAFRL